MRTSASPWPELNYTGWRDTLAGLQLRTQIVGKVRLALSPWLNHGWQVPLYVTARGLGTSPIPASHDGHEVFELEFDFIAQALVARTSSGDESRVPLDLRTPARRGRRCKRSRPAPISTSRSSS